MESKLNFYTSHDLSLLARQLAINISADKSDLFKTTHIVTQTSGINKWLEQSLTLQKDDGGNTLMEVFINYKFHSPMEFVMNVYKAIGGNLLEDKLQTNIVWLVYQVLEKDEMFKSKFSSIYGYFKDDKAKQYELSVKVADLFDQYEVYRPEMLRKWKAGKHYLENNFHEEWQRYIWRKIMADGKEKMLDKTSIGDFIVDALNEETAQENLRKSFAQIHFFGLSTLASYHLNILEKIAQIIPLNLYLVNHSPNNYWVEDKSEKDLLRMVMRKKKFAGAVQGNELLTNWGKLIQESIIVLYRNGEYINVEKNLSEGKEVKYPDTLLGKVQHSIFENTVWERDVERPITLELLNDGSITVSSNYSIIREVQSLYNYLVDTFASLNVDGKKSTTKDVLVMVTDVNAYAPYIKAVFDNAPHQFYYSITDEAITKGNNIIAAILALLHLSEAKFTSLTVLQLLEFESIRQRTGLKDVALVQHLVTEANIRYGYENNLEDDTYLVSFKQGLKRLMYGACFDGETDYAGVLTVDAVDSQNDLMTISLLTHFVEKLHRHILERKQARSLKDWQQFINHTATEFLYEKKDEDDLNVDYNSILYKVLEPGALLDLMDDVEIPFEVFRTHIEKELSYLDNQTKFISGGITFCSPIPYRSVPFHIIAMLGLNFDNFPRMQQTSDYDLLKHREYGDRNIKFNDKHLMLESLMSAKQRLYLSYIGKNIQKNNTKPPSILVDELLNYIQEMTNEQTDVRAYLVKEHPLHSYSTKYNSSEKPSLRNYLIRAAKEKVDNGAKMGERIFPKELTIRDIEKFCENTIQYYYNNILGIYIGEHLVQMQETEHFFLNKLEEWFVKGELFVSKMKNEGKENALELKYRRGEMPLKSSLESVKKSVNDRLQPMEQLLENAGLMGGSFAKKNIQPFDIGGVKISGDLEWVDEHSTLLLPMFSKESSYRKYQLKAFLGILIGAITGDVKKGYYLGMAKKDVLQMEECKIAGNPQEILSNILQIMKAFYRKVFVMTLALADEKFEDEDGMIAAIEENLLAKFPDVYLQHFWSDPSAFAALDIGKANQMIEDVYDVITNSFKKIDGKV